MDLWLLKSPKLKRFKNSQFFLLVIFVSYKGFGQQKELNVKYLIYFLLYICICLDEYEDYAAESLFYLETVIVFWFGIEFFVRLWSAGCRSR